MNKKSKETILGIIGLIVIFAVVFIWLFGDSLFKPEPYVPMTAQETHEVERKLIDRYGSLEAAEDSYREQNDPGNGVGHPLYNN